MLKVENDYRYFDLMVKWNNIGVGAFQLEAKALSALIKIAEIQKIHIMIYTMYEAYPTNMAQALKNWLQICQAMDGRFFFKRRKNF